jgi:hypothetical protein
MWPVTLIPQDGKDQVENTLLVIDDEDLGLGGQKAFLAGKCCRHAANAPADLFSHP